MEGTTGRRDSKTSFLALVTLAHVDSELETSRMVAEQSAPIPFFLAIRAAVVSVEDFNT